MVFFNHATRQMTAKIVYYGPGLCGKTTNLNTIYARTAQKSRGEMVSLNTETDRTLFFDLLPMDVGMVGGFKAKLQLYTVPGQVFYNSTRKLVLKGVDGIVFVADSQVPMLDANKESLQNLTDNLKELGLVIGDIPMVFQWNKRDLKNIVPIPTLEAELNPKGLPSFQTIAQEGTGVFETLRGVTKLALAQIKALHLADSVAAKPVAEPAVVAKPKPVVEKSAPVAPAPIPVVPAPDPPVVPAEPVAAAHPLAEALSFLDLPSGSDLFKDLPAAVPEPEPVPAAVTGSAPRIASTVQVMAPLTVTMRPPLAKGLGATPMVHPPKPGLRPPGPQSAPRPQAAPSRPSAPMAAPAASAPPRLAKPSTALRVMLPQGLNEEELEVVVLVRQNGMTIAESSAYRPIPLKGVTGLLSVEIKRP